MFKEFRVKDEEAVGDTATSFECALPKALISAIHVRMSGTGGSGTVALTHAMLANLRIDTDGNDKKPVDLSLAQLARREGILFGVPPATISADGAYSSIEGAIYFGDKPRDKRLMLDLRNCKKRKFKITFDAVLVSATRMAAGNAQFTVLVTAWVGQAPTEYIGHIRQEEAFAWATGTGDKSDYDLPIHSGGKLAFIDLTVSAVTTVENVAWTANSDSISLINEHIRDNIHRMNVQRHLDTLLTLTAYFDFMFVSKYESQVKELPVCDRLQSTKLEIERGATTTTVVGVLGTILA